MNLRSDKGTLTVLVPLHSASPALHLTRSPLISLHVSSQVSHVVSRPRLSTFLLASPNWPKALSLVPFSSMHSSFPNPLTSAPLSLCNQLAQPARLPLSHFSVHPSVIALNSLVVLSAILPLFFGTTFTKVILSNSFSVKFH
jgi:hypothetical protein